MMKKLISSIFMLILTVYGQQMQAMPIDRFNAGGTFIGIGDGLAMLKKLGISVSDTDKLHEDASCSRTSNIIWNTTLNRLRIYNGTIWKDAIQHDLEDYYTKTEIDSIIATINSLLAAKANANEVVKLTGNETITGVKTFSDDLVASGNVGIGTATPDRKLHIVGNVKVQANWNGSFYNSAQSQIQGSNPAIAFNFPNNPSHVLFMNNWGSSRADLIRAYPNAAGH